MVAASESEPTFEVGRFYPLSEFRAEWARYFSERAVSFPVPVTVMVRQNTNIGVPNGRGYRTPWATNNYDDETSDNLIMFEVYRPKHTLMNVRWVHVGFVFLPERAGAQWVATAAETDGVHFDEMMVLCLAHFARNEVE